MAFRYEWIDSLMGDCKLQIDVDDISAEINILDLLTEFLKLQNTVNEWDTETYSEEAMEDFDSKFNLLDNFITIKKGDDK